MRWFRLRSTRFQQVGFLVLLGVCALQILFWTVDEVRFSRQMKALEVNAELQKQLAARERRYIAEGAFFFITVVAGMFVLARALRARAEWHRLEGNFLAAVTHELKTPLAGIRLTAETALMRDAGDAKAQQRMGRILADVDRLEMMVANILATNRLDEAGWRQGAAVPVDLRDVLRSAVEAQRPVFGRHGIEVEEAWALERDAMADPSSVEMVVRNLLDNAVKAIGVGRPREPGAVANQAPRGEVRLTLTQEPDAAVLSVTDDGVGFVPDEAEALFEKFYRVGDELRRVSSGSGLGLYLVRTLVERDGGTVHARSEGEGRGATFEVRWPLAAESAA